MTRRIYDEYELLAGKAALFELYIRLLADKTPELKPYVHKNLQFLEEKLYEHFSEKISDEELHILERTRPLRNRILHGNFSSAKNKLEETTKTELDRDNVHMMRFSTDEVKSVADTSIKEGGIFGWLLESATNGFFPEAFGIFEKANAIIYRISFETAVGG